MDKNLKYSVALTTYNGEEYIITQLESICSQTITPNEIIICDDCSIDKTVELIENYILISNINIKLIVNHENFGVRKNFEKCVGFCKNEIIFFSDQDDIWFQNKVEKMISFFEADRNIVYVFSNGFVTDEYLNTINKSEWAIDWAKLNIQEYFDFCQTRNFPLGHLCAARKDFVDSIRPFLSDPDGWIAQCAPAFGNVVAIPDKLMYFRRHENTTSKAFNYKRSRIDIFKDLFKMSYQEYFTWPEAETNTYSKILEYVYENGCKVSPSKLEEHIDYLTCLSNAEKSKVFSRIKTIIKMYHNGIYQQYRGNINTLVKDLVFIVINSVTKN